MSKQSNPIAIGGFVLGALVLAVAGILTFGSGALLQEKVSTVTYFPGTVKGLELGARVEFQGVKVGQVTDIKLDYWPAEGRFAVPVYLEIWPDSLRQHGDVQGTRRTTNLQVLVEKYGLRTRLEPESLVTGKYMVALELRPDTAANFVGDRTTSQIPSVESTRDRISNLIEDLDLDALVSSAISALNDIQALVADDEMKALAGQVNKTMRDAQRMLGKIDAAVEPTVQRIDRTLADYSGLARTAAARANTLADRVEAAAVTVARLSQDISNEIKPISSSAVAALEQTRKALGSIDDLVNDDSTTRFNLDAVLEEAAGAARSLRTLADYLEQNPDALIKGKY